VHFIDDKRGDLSTPPDWQLLEKIFSLDENGGDPDLQEKFVMGYTREAAEQTLRSLLSMIGYTQEDIEKISQLAKSQEIKDSLATQRTIVEEKIRTIKIPTLLFDGRRFDRVVSIETLR
jgi:hypothetical protein